MVELKTPEEWSKQFNIRICDPDGWRRPDHQSWITPISIAEYVDRMGSSTVHFKDRDSYDRMMARYREEPV